uniref:Uncharacterized protein n=1 Tax=Glossina brevipalpis TaxID=37001 RepID=A0A1A9WUL1_9MUSC
MGEKQKHHTINICPYAIVTKIKLTTVRPKLVTILLFYYIVFFAGYIYGCNKKFQERYVSLKGVGNNAFTIGVSWRWQHC